MRLAIKGLCYIGPEAQLAHSRRWKSHDIADIEALLCTGERPILLEALGHRSEMPKLHGRNQRQVSTPMVPKRPGDQYFVDVRIEEKARTSGITATTFGIALGTAPVPDRRYVADVCSVTPEGSGVKVAFAQFKVGQKQLRSAVVIKMSRRGVAHFLGSIDSVKDPSYAEIAIRDGFTPMAPEPLTSEPDQVVTLAANFALSAMSDQETSIDFLQMSPFAMAAMAKGAQQAAIDPVVRIDLSSDLFLGLIEALRALPGVQTDLVEIST